MVNGGLYCWGVGWYGQLGDGDGTDHLAYEPVKVSKLTTGVTAVSAGTLPTSDSAGFTCAIVGGAAKCWGAVLKDALAYDLPDDQLLPTIVPGLEGGVAAIASDEYSCAVRGGEVLCWGLANGWGQLGDGTSQSRNPPLTAVKVVGLGSNGATAIAVGDLHACAVVDGRIMCWGSNIFGELGNNSTVSSSTPVSVQF